MIDRTYFEDLYTGTHDPWGFETEWYEQRKYALTLASLPRQVYRSGFEPGCSIGVLTEQLAGRCERLVASDLFDDTLDRARSRVTSLPSVEIGRLEIPTQWPDRRFDLVVLSEVAYYLDGAELDEVVHRLAATVEPGGHVVAVHWTGATNYPLSGGEVHERLGRADFLRCLVNHRDEQFQLDLWERR